MDRILEQNHRHRHRKLTLNLGFIHQRFRSFIQNNRRKWWRRRRDQCPTEISRQRNHCSTTLFTGYFRSLFHWFFSIFPKFSLIFHSTKTSADTRTFPAQVCLNFPRFRESEIAREKFGGSYWLWIKKESWWTFFWLDENRAAPKAAGLHGYVQSTNQIYAQNIYQSDLRAKFLKITK